MLRNHDNTCTTWTLSMGFIVVLCLLASHLSYASRKVQRHGVIGMSGTCELSGRVVLKNNSSVIQHIRITGQLTGIDFTMFPLSPLCGSGCSSPDSPPGGNWFKLQPAGWVIYAANWSGTYAFNFLLDYTVEIYENKGFIQGSGDFKVSNGGETWRIAVDPNNGKPF